MNFLIATTLTCTILGFFSTLKADELKETLTLQLPSNMRGKWKEHAREIECDKAMKAYIPVEQTSATWNEQIVFTSLNFSTHDLSGINPNDFLISLLKQNVEKKYSGSKTSWNILENRERDIIYELILHEPHRDTCPVHEIGRTVITPKGNHNITFARRCGSITKKEKESWITRLKAATISATSDTQKGYIGKLSVFDTDKMYLPLPKIFDGWSITRVSPFHDQLRYISCTQPHEGYNPHETLLIIEILNKNDVTLKTLKKFLKKEIQDTAESTIEEEYIYETADDFSVKYTYTFEGNKFITIARGILYSDAAYCIARIKPCEKDNNQKEIIGALASWDTHHLYQSINNLLKN